MRRLLRAVLAAALAGASLDALAAPVEEVIDEIAVEAHDATARIRLHLTTPVRYLGHQPAEFGENVRVVLQAMAPENLGGSFVPEEVKRSPKDARVAPFTVRVSLDPACDPTPNPICIAIRFERATHFRIRLGRDRRSLLLELPVAASTDDSPPAPGAKP